MPSSANCRSASHAGASRCSSTTSRSRSDVCYNPTILDSFEQPRVHECANLFGSRGLPKMEREIIQPRAHDELERATGEICRIEVGSAEIRREQATRIRYCGGLWRRPIGTCFPEVE